MSAFPVDSTQASVMLYGSKLGPNLVDGKPYNINYQVEVAQSNIAQSNRQTQQNIQEQISQGQQQARQGTKAADDPLGQNIDVYA